MLQEGTYMPLVVLRVSTLRKISTIAACVLACACFQTPIALAQRVGHVGGGGHFAPTGRVAPPHIGAPHVIAPPVSRAPGSRAMFSHPRVGFPGRSPLIFRHPFFIPAPFFRFGFRDRFDSSWWLNCGPIWGWEYGCGDFFLPEYTFEHYLPPPLTYNTPVYIYGLDDHPLVQLFLTDGTVYSVNDYWFVNNELHFTMLDESATKPVEQVIPFEDLDVQRTINVNSRRGFRVVMRNEPLEQYARDYPDLAPPLLLPPQKD
jgi:hypothetical protein